MIISLDCETQGLSGPMIECAIHKSKARNITCKTTQEVWETITELAKAEARRTHTLHIYAHNMKFDFFKIADWTKQGLTIKRTMPFIAEYSFPYKESRKPDKTAKILFLDTWGLFRRSLKSCARLIGEEKLELSESLKSGETRTELTEEERRYMIKDAEICYKLIERVKTELKKYNCNVRTIISIGQIAMNCFLAWCKKENYKDIFQDQRTNELIKLKHEKEIHEAYRYGRIEATRTEIKKGVYEVDINNLYSYSAANGPYPEFSTERKISKPLKTFSKDGFKKLLEQYPIGVTKGVLKSPRTKSSYGFIVSKIEDQLFFPREKNRYIAGSWTNLEVHKALELGYRPIDIEYTITFKTAKRNPFKKYFEEIYHRRKNGDEFSDFFWKQIANFTIGKFAQKKTKNRIRNR